VRQSAVREVLLVSIFHFHFLSSRGPGGRFPGQLEPRCEAGGQVRSLISGFAVRWEGPRCEWVWLVCSCCNDRRSHAIPSNVNVFRRSDSILCRI